MGKYEHLKAKIRDIRDFPTPGVKFRDITPLLEDAAAFKEAIEGLVEFFMDKNVRKVVGIDARGFLLSSAVAYILGTGMVIVRKKGKLPYNTIVQEHSLEYGTSTLEIHKDAISKGERVAIIDDVIATGGTAGAAVKLVEALEGKIVGLGFFLELSEFPGRKALEPYPLYSLIVY